MRLAYETSDYVVYETDTRLASLLMLIEYTVILMICCVGTLCMRLVYEASIYEASIYYIYIYTRLVSMVLRA